MLCGAGVLPDPSGLPVFADSFQVQTIQEALDWVSQFSDAGVCSNPLAQIQQELEEKGWSRFACSSVIEYFLQLDPVS